CRHRASDTVTLQHVEAGGVVSGDGGERLVELVRQAISPMTRPRGYVQPLLLRARKVLRALALGHVEHRAHPPALPSLTVDQRRFVDERIEALVVAALEAKLGTFGRRIAGEPRFVLLPGALHFFRQP